MHDRINDWRGGSRNDAKIETAGSSSHDGRLNVDDRLGFIALRPEAEQGGYRRVDDLVVWIRIGWSKSIANK